MLAIELREVGRQSIRELIPSTFAALKRASRSLEVPDVVVLCHDRSSRPAYHFRTLDGRVWSPPTAGGLDAYSLLQPLRAVYARGRGGPREVPNVFVAFDLGLGHAWSTRAFKSLRNVAPERRLDAETLGPASLPIEDTAPRVAERAQMFHGEHIRTLRYDIGSGRDLPEEVFLLHDELLHLAVDSLREADVLDPLPVHTNAVWVFARPVILQRPDGHERHVRAVWFRHGQAVWRLRTYVGGTRGRRVHVEEIGEQLAGRSPFVPRWDAAHPEQKLLAAVWALMSQGGLTELEPAGTNVANGGPITGPGDEQTGLHVVRVKAGTEHAAVYRQSRAGWSARSAWSVRGHWRRQPYASLGLDEYGRTRTKLIWIASYTKGATDQAPPASKIIEVR